MINLNYKLNPNLWRKTKFRSDLVSLLKTLLTMSITKITEFRRFLHSLTTENPSLKRNLMRRPKRSSNGPKRRVLCTTHSFASHDLEASQKSKRPFWIWIISSTKAKWHHRETAILTLRTYWKVKVMGQVFHQGDWDKLAMQEPTPSGI